MASIRVAAPLAMLLLSGCVTGPEHTPPQTPLPEKFAEGGKKTNGEVAMAAWWTAFNDRRLNGLVEQGIDQNLDVLQAMERITAAEAGVIVAGAGGLPSLNLSADETISKTKGTEELQRSHHRYDLDGQRRPGRVLAARPLRPVSPR